MVSRRTVVAAIALVALGIVGLLWLPIPDDTSISHTVIIERPPEAVFTYVTTPGNWPKWHPASGVVR